MPKIECSAAERLLILRSNRIDFLTSSEVAAIEAEAKLIDAQAAKLRAEATELVDRARRGWDEILGVIAAAHGTEPVGVKARMVDADGLLSLEWETIAIAPLDTSPKPPTPEVEEDAQEDEELLEEAPPRKVLGGFGDELVHVPTEAEAWDAKLAAAAEALSPALESPAVG